MEQRRESGGGEEEREEGTEGRIGDRRARRGQKENGLKGEEGTDRKGARFAGKEGR